eukprot:scaffold2253_cov119-Cylindrotheca_fusiformis.AAC.24
MEREIMQMRENRQLWKTLLPYPNNGYLPAQWYAHGRLKMIKYDGDGMSGTILPGLTGFVIATTRLFNLLAPSLLLLILLG